MKFNIFTPVVRTCAAFLFSKRRIRVSSTFVLMLCALHPSLGLGQHINLNRQNISINDALMEFKKQSNVSILYNDASIGQFKVKSINLKNASIQQAMDNLLQNTAFEYKLTTENSILIKRKANQPVNAPKLQQQDSLKGTVVDDKK